MLEFIKDLHRPLHNKVVSSLGIIAMTFGAAANLQQYGVRAATGFLALSLLALFILMSEIGCVLSGRCHTTALLNTGIAVAIFISVIWYYARIMFDGGGAGGLPAVKDQPIAKVDRAVIPISGLVEDGVKELIQRDRMSHVE